MLVNEKRTTLLDELARLRADGQPWHAFARLIKDWSKGFDHPERRRREIWEAAEERTGISTTMLKRYFAVLAQIDGIAEAHGMDLTELLPASFTGAELAARLYSRDPNKGLEALKGLRARSTTIEEVRGGLEKAASGLDGNIVRARYGLMVDKCESIMTRHASDVFGNGAVSQRRPMLRHFGTMGFEFRDAASGLLAGGDLYLPGLASDPLIRICSSVLLSGYFPAFWLMLGPGLDEGVIGRAEEALAVLCPRIGILLLEEDGVAVRRPAERVAEGAERSSAYVTLVERFGGRGMDVWQPPA